MLVEAVAMAAYAGKSHMLQGGFLAPTEKLLLETHPSKWFYFPGPVLGLALLLIADYIAATGVYRTLPAIPVVTRWITSVHFPFIGGTLGLSNVLLFIALAATLGVGLWLVYRLFDWISDVYAVTNERLIKQQGIVTHDFEEIPIKQVHNVEVHQRRLAARILSYGTLQMDSLANLSGAVKVSQSGGYTPNAPRAEPYSTPRSADAYLYMNPRAEEADRIGVQVWLMVPNPIRIQRTIERAAEGLDAGHGPGA